MLKALFVVIPLVVLVGCSSSGKDASTTASRSPNTVDTSTVEQQIETQLSGPTVTITSVSCPSDVTKQKGATFDCTANIKGGG